jgi:hypothetical protein
MPATIASAAQTTGSSCDPLGWTTCVIPPRVDHGGGVDDLASAQLAAVSYLARYAGHTTMHAVRGYFRFAHIDGLPWTKIVG